MEESLLGFKVLLAGCDSIDHDGHPTGHVVEEFTLFAFFCSTLVAPPFVTSSLRENGRPRNLSLECLLELCLSSFVRDECLVFLLVYFT